MVGVRQLLSLGLDDCAIARLVARGFLIRLHPGVYAVGYRPRGVEARLQSALLIGGDRSVLSHHAAAFWLGLTDREPGLVEVRGPRHLRSRPGMLFHRSSALISIRVRGLAVTSPAPTLVDYAARVPPSQLRRAIAAADRLGMLDPRALRESMQRGRAGSSAVRSALASYLPELASTLSELEDRFLELVARAGLPIPEVNTTVGGMMVDALFTEHRLVIELDGHRFHAHAAASEEDRDRELRLRALGYRVVRYTWKQITSTPAVVVADLRRELGLGSTAIGDLGSFTVAGQ